MEAAAFFIPEQGLLIVFAVAPVVIMGGQIGSMFNSKLSDHMLVKLIMIAYTLVGAFMLFNVVRSW